MISVAVSGQTTQFVYDGDGNLVEKIKPDGSKTLYVGGVYEVDKTSGGSTTRTVTYYPAAGAMRINSTLYYVLKDQLVSATTLQVDNSPVKHFLLKFDVTGLNGQTVTNAKIRLYNVNAATAGGNFYHVSDDSWQEDLP